MDKINNALIELLAYSTGCQASTAIDLKKDEWQLLFNEAIAHQIHLLIFQEAYKYGSTVNPELFEMWKKITIIFSLSSENRLSIIRDVLSSLKEAEIPVLALKGLYFKYLYNYSSFRIMGDVDLLTKKESLADTVKVIESFGYKQRYDVHDLKHLVFYHEQYIGIELHFSLVTESRREAAANLNNEIWKSAVYYQNNNLQLLIPSDFNHILYCCIHMTNHLGKGGFGLRQLSDFNLLMRKNISTIDMGLLMEQAYEYGIGKFLEALLYICHKLFYLQIPDSVVNLFKNSEDYVDQLINLIVESGVFGGKDNVAASNRSLAYSIEKNAMEVKRFSMRYLFPPRGSLSSTYSYARDHAILLPAAWIHRLINNVFRRDLSIRDKIPDSNAINKYIKLFRWLDIK